MKRPVIRVICFLLILGSVLIYMDRAFRYKYGDGIYNLKKFYELDNDSVDVLILGSSHAFENFNTGTLWDEYGIAAFDLCGSNQPLWNSYYYLKEALKTQHPKLIILEGTMVEHYSDYSTDENIIKNNYGLRWSYDKFMSLLASIPSDRRTDFLPEYAIYHNRYSSLTSEDFLKDQGVPYYFDWKGFGCNMGTTPFEGNDLSNVTEIGPISPKCEWWFTHIIEFAQEQNIPLEIIIAPYAECYDDEQRVFNNAAQIAKERDVPFTNCNLLVNEIGIDYSTDAADTDHLNYKGNVKFTKYIGDIITEKYDLPDHRGEPAYDSWERQAYYYRRLIGNQRFRECTNLDEYLSIVRDPGFADYEVFVSSDLQTADEKDYYIELPLADIHVTNDSVTVNHKGYAMDTPGVTVLVYDNVIGQVVDYVVFDENGTASRDI